jgi:protein-disulfide isomerase
MSKESMSKRKARREQRRRAEQRSRLVVIAGVVLVALAFAALLIAPNFTPVGEVKTAESFPRPQADGNAAGDPNAPIKIEEFSDFQCPVCERFYRETERQLMETYVATGKVYFVYRSFGEFIGPESQAAAEAAYCAGDQNKFWEMHDIIFANQTGENVGNFTDRRLTAFAEKIGLDLGAFKSCFNGHTYSSRVAKDHTDGLATGMQGTPAFLITYAVNSQPQTDLIPGALPFSEFQSKIDAALARIGP